MTKFDQITTSTSTLATFLAALPTMKGPWDEAFDKAFCSSCAVQDCNEEGVPVSENQGRRDPVVADNAGRR